MGEEARTSEIVKGWYTRIEREEWERLGRDPYHRVEFITTMHLLGKHLPREGLVLDAGGGPGRYTIELAKRGYEVVLLDITPRLLGVAREKIEEAGVGEGVRGVLEGSITDLSAFPEGSFDAVLCLGGPLNHILEGSERRRAAGELARVAKRGAPIIASVISRLGLLKTILREFPDEIQDCAHHLETGDYIPGVLPREEVKGFTAAHWFLPEELRELFEGQGVEVLEMAACEGLSSHLEEETNRLAGDGDKWGAWVEVLLRTCNHPSIVGASEHFLLVGRKG